MVIGILIDPRECSRVRRDFVAYGEKQRRKDVKRAEEEKRRERERKKEEDREGERERESESEARPVAGNTLRLEQLQKLGRKSIRWITASWG